MRMVVVKAAQRIATHEHRSISPLTANIYFPAIPTLARVFHKSTELINLTVTVYMVLQGACELSARARRATPSVESDFDRSAYAMGSNGRPRWEATHLPGVSSHTFAVLRRTGTGSYIRLLAPHALALHSGCRVCKHCCPWYVFLDVSTGRNANDTCSASGVMGDIATRAERGGFVGVSGIGALVG